MKSMLEVLKMLEESETELKKLNEGIENIKMLLKSVATAESTERQFMGYTIPTAQWDLETAAGEADDLIGPAEIIYNNLPRIRDAIDDIGRAGNEQSL